MGVESSDGTLCCCISLFSSPMLHPRPTMDQVVKMLEAHSYNGSAGLPEKDQQWLLVRIVSNCNMCHESIFCVSESVILESAQNCDMWHFKN